MGVTVARLWLLLTLKTGQMEVMVAAQLLTEVMEVMEGTEVTARR
jgi:hypothetical protein